MRNGPARLIFPAAALNTAAVSRAGAVALMYYFWYIFP